MTTPMPTFTDGQFVRQGQLNLLSAGINNLSLLLAGANQPRAYVPAVAANINATQAIANNVDQTVTWNTTSINNDGMWVNTATDHLTIGSTGVFLCWARVHFAANATASRAAHIMLNGTSIIANSVGVTSVNAVGAAADTIFTCMTAPLRLAAGSTLYLSVYQNSGGALNLLTTLSGTMFSAIRIGQ
jgi:hypothetical protein